MDIVIALIVFLFGNCIGSFLNVLTMRMPQGRRASGRSACPHCGHVLSPLDLFPLFSYMLLGGRCRYCKRALSFRYPLIELITGLLFLIVWIALGPQSIFEYVILARAWFCVGTFIVIFTIDFEHFLIPDRVVLPAAGIILASNLIIDFSRGTFGLNSFSVLALVAGLVGYGLIWSIWKVSSGQWIGLGDAKLLLFLGLALGWPGILVAFFVALASGTSVSIALLLTKKKTMRSALPFGTFLVFGGLVTILCGQTLWNWYMVILGFA